MLHENILIPCKQDIKTACEFHEAGVKKRVIDVVRQLLNEGYSFEEVAGMYEKYKELCSKKVWMQAVKREKEEREKEIYENERYLIQLEKYLREKYLREFEFKNPGIKKYLTLDELAAIIGKDREFLLHNKWILRRLLEKYEWLAFADIPLKAVHEGKGAFRLEYDW